MTGSGISVVLLGCDSSVWCRLAVPLVKDGLDVTDALAAGRDTAIHPVVALVGRDQTDPIATASHIRAHHPSSEVFFVADPQTSDTARAEARSATAAFDRTHIVDLDADAALPAVRDAVARARAREPWTSPHGAAHAGLLATHAFRTVVDTLPFGVTIVEWEHEPDLGSFRFVYSNRTAARNAGAPVQSYVGKTVRERYPALLDTPLPGLYAETIRTGQPLRLSGFEYRGRDQATPPSFDVTLFPLGDRRAGIVTEDISDLVETNRQREGLVRKLERINAELEHFVSLISHDLQEPLRMVASFTDLLAEEYGGKLDADANEYIAFASDGARRMQRQLADLRAYSHVTSQGRPLRPTDAGPALARARSMVEPLLHAKGGRITHGEMPWVIADPNQLVQLFERLLDNALRFARDRAPQVHIEWRQEADDIAFAIRDNGEGIDTRDADRIFLIFRRLKDRPDETNSGSGLAICTRILERHGGRIWVDSTPGEGSTFFFTLPAYHPMPGP